MNKISLSSVLILCLAIPFVMGYRISPGDTPYWLFGLIVLALFFNIFMDLIKIDREKYYFIKFFLLWFIILSTIGAGFLSAIIVRYKGAPVYMIHDIILQLEAAIHFFVKGINPYATTYFGTFLEQWHYSDTQVNPALYHFVMEPFYLLFSIPFYAASVRLFGFFDGRMPLFFLFFLMLINAFILIKDKEKKLLFVILLTFNPAMLSYTLEGRSDMFAYAFLFLGFYLLHKQKYLLSGIPIALSFAVKQSVWPIFPLYFAFLYFKNKALKKTLKELSLFFFVFLAIVLPFFAWNPKAFIDSTILYLSGSVLHSYPVSGYGFGMVLHELGIIKDLNAYYPFWIWQLLFGLPLSVILIKYLRKNTSINKLILFYGLFLFVFWYFSRYLNNSHFGYLSVIFITAYFWPEENLVAQKKD